MTSRFSGLFAMAILAAIGLLIYSNSFQASFHFDDEGSIVNNLAIRNPFDLQAIWSFRPQRFLPYWSFAFNYYYSGLEVFSYHLVNWIIHFLAASLVFGIAKLTLETPRLKKTTDETGKWQISLFAALFFLVHPLQTQAVTYIVQRIASLAALFFLASIFFHICARRDKNKFFMILSLFSGAAAMMSKENTYILPFTVLLYEVTFFESGKNAWMKALPFFILPAAAFLLFYAGRAETQGLASVARLETELSRKDYFLTQLNVIRTYLRIFIFPSGQTLEYDYAVSKSLFEKQTLLSLALLTGLAGWGVWLISRERLAAFGIFWFFLALSVESSFIPIKDIVFEHRMYLPLAGLVLAAAVLIYRLSRSTREFVVIVCFAVAILSVLTYQRNKVWQDEFSLWSDVVKKSPEKARAYVNLGSDYGAKGETDKAVELFKKAIELDPEYAKAYFNLGVSYASKRDFENAISMYEKSLQLDSRDPETFYHLGVAYQAKGDQEKAKINYEKSVSLAPHHAGAQNNLGFYYYEKRDYVKAARHYAEVVKAAPEAGSGYYHLGLALNAQGNHREAVKHYLEAILRQPKKADYYFGAGTAYSEMGDFKNGIYYLETARDLLPSEITLRNLALAYIKDGREKEARDTLQEMRSRGQTAAASEIASLLAQSEAVPTATKVVTYYKDGRIVNKQQISS